MPSELDELQRNIRQLEIEKAALSKEKDESSKKRLASLEEDLNKKKETEAKLIEEWKVEKANILEAKKLKEEKEKAQFDLDLAFSKGEYEKAGELKYKTIPNLTKRLEELDKSGKDGSLLSEVVRHTR